jgi:hypothetical protein
LIIPGQGKPARRAYVGLATRALMILLAIWAVAIIAPEFYRVVAPVNSIGLSADNDGKIVDVVYPFDRPADSPAAQSGIVPGQRLDLSQMHCKAPLSDRCTGAVTVLGDFGGVQYTSRSDEITLLILPKNGGAPLTFHIQPAPAHLHWHSRAGLLADTTVGILFVCVAFYLLWTRPSRMTWGFFLYAIWFNPGQDYAFYALLQLWPPGVLIEQLLETVIRGAAFAGLLAFALSFPGETVEPRWQRLNAAVPWVGAVMTILAMLSGANLYGYRTEIVTQINLFALIPFDVLAISILILRLRTLPPQDEERMRWAIAGCAIGLPAFLVAELCQSTGRHRLFRRDGHTPAPRHQRRHPTAPRRDPDRPHLHPGRADRLSARQGQLLWWQHQRAFSSSRMDLARRREPGDTHGPDTIAPPRGRADGAGFQPALPSRAGSAA